jgi:Domain of unknown function (DUF4249)
MKYLILPLVVLSVVFACQKEIDVDLNEANSQVVLEANYTAEDSIVRVHISLTSSFFDSNPSTSIDNAVVTIKDYTGAAQSLVSLGNGDFELLNYVPIFNTTYTMNIDYNGVNYEAQSDLGSPVNMEDITYFDSPGFFGGPGGYVANLNFWDPIDTVNYYLIVQTLNGDEKNSLDELLTQDDLFTDGNLLERPLYGSKYLAIGDTLSLELRSIDEDIFYYYNEAISIVGSGQASAAPANPTTNWNNKALGYFSAYSNSRKSVIIQ